MKKLVYLIIMSLLLTLVPVDSAEAATKAVATPVVTSVYDKKLDDFKYKFTHPNKNAVIYYRGVDTKKWKRAKNGQTLKLGYFEQQDGIYVYAKVGRTKSKARWVNTRGLDEKKVDYLIKQEMNKLIDKDDQVEMKFAKLLVHFNKKYNYTLAYADADNRDLFVTRTFFRGAGECDSLARTFIKYCKAIGIKAEYVCTGSVDYKYSSGIAAHAWTHVYLDKYPILVDPTQVVAKCNSALYDYCSLDVNSYKKSKYNFKKAFAGTRGIEEVVNGKIRRGKLPFEYMIPDENADVRFEKNKMILDYDDGEWSYTAMYEYYPSTGYWYYKFIDYTTGEIEDGKAEVDAWYAAHPEVERVYGKNAVRK